MEKTEIRKDDLLTYMLMLQVKYKKFTGAILQPIFQTGYPGSASATATVVEGLRVDDYRPMDMRGVLKLYLPIIIILLREIFESLSQSNFQIVFKVERIFRSSALKL